MRRRLGTLAAMSALALVLNVSPVFASGHADGQDGHDGHWVVMGRDSTAVADYPVDCGHATYTVASGTVKSLWLQKGTVDASGIALDAGRGVETWTLSHVRIQNDATHRVYDAVGSMRLEVAWAKGADVGAGDFTSGSLTEFVRIEGTRDGRSWVQVLKNGSFVTVMDRGTCSQLQIGLN